MSIRLLNYWINSQDHLITTPQLASSSIFIFYIKSLPSWYHSFFSLQFILGHQGVISSCKAHIIGMLYILCRTQNQNEAVHILTDKTTNICTPKNALGQGHQSIYYNQYGTSTASGLTRSDNAVHLTRTQPIHIRPGPLG